jgi:hypothetical protein
MAEDVSGWIVRAIEMYMGLAFTQNLSHLMIDIGRTADLRKFGAIGEPFNEMAHLADLSSKGLFTFSALGNDAPLYVHPRDDESSGSLSVPMAISRRALESRTEDYYGKGRRHIHLGWNQEL